MAKIVLPVPANAHQRALKHAIEVLDRIDIHAEGKILLVYPMLRVAERDAHSAVNVLRSVGIEASLG